MMLMVSIPNLSAINQNSSNIMAIVMCQSVGHVINFLAFLISSSLHVPISASFVCFASQSVHLQSLVHVLYCHSKL